MVLVSFRMNEEGYVDDIFTILDRDQVDGFLQHLNNQKPTIRFTMETEKDNSIPFSIRQLYGTQTAFLLPVCTESPHTLINT